MLPLTPSCAVLQYTLMAPVSALTNARTSAFGKFAMLAYVLTSGLMPSGSVATCRNAPGCIDVCMLTER